MNPRVVASLFVLGVWWLSTGVVLRLVWLGRSTARLVIFGALAAGATYGIFASATVPTAGGAYTAFVCALTVWGFHELLFLLGVVTGPRKIPCPPESHGWRRFGYATAAVIHHEVALALTLLTIVALTWGGANQVGTSTFLVLWVMRLSAKLNVFLGVRNLSEQFVPQHLRYMLSYFRRARMNALMPVSLLVGSWVVLRLAAAPGMAGGAADAMPFETVGRTLVATLLALAVLEHVFLTVPLPDALLWRWATRVKGATGEPLRSLGAESP